MMISVEKLDLLLANNIIPIQKLSEDSGVSRVTIARMRSGTQKARPQTIGKLAKALGCKVEDLLEEER